MEMIGRGERKRLGRSWLGLCWYFLLGFLACAPSVRAQAPPDGAQATWDGGHAVSVVFVACQTSDKGNCACPVTGGSNCYVNNNFSIYRNPPGFTKLLTAGSEDATVSTHTYIDTNATPGQTYTYKVCGGGYANSSSSNCINTNAVTVENPPPPPPPPPQAGVQLTANPTAIEAGDETKLTWRSENATNLILEPGDMTGLPLSGSTSINPSQTTTYTVYVSGKYGTANASVTVAVGKPCPTWSRPQNMFSLGGMSQVELKWTNPSVDPTQTCPPPPTQVVVYRRSATYQQIAALPSSNGVLPVRYTDTGSLQPHTTYHYLVCEGGPPKDWENTTNCEGNGTSTWGADPVLTATRVSATSVKLEIAVDQDIGISSIVVTREGSDDPCRQGGALGNGLQGCRTVTTSPNGVGTPVTGQITTVYNWTSLPGCQGSGCWTTNSKSAPYEIDIPNDTQVKPGVEYYYQAKVTWIGEQDSAVVTVPSAYATAPPQYMLGGGPKPIKLNGAPPPPSQSGASPATAPAIRPASPMIAPASPMMSSEGPAAATRASEPLNAGSGGSGLTSLEPLAPRGTSNGDSSTGSAGSSEKPLTNADVLKLLRAGISEQNILTLIRNHPATLAVSNQARADFDRNCAAIKKPAGVSTDAWATELKNIWDAMTNVVICQQTNGRGGEGACQPNSGTNNNGNGTARELSPQPSPVKGKASAAQDEAERQLKAELAAPPVRGKTVAAKVSPHGVRSNAATIAVLQKQRQAADLEVAQMKLGIHAPGAVGVPGGESQTMSANGTHSAAGVAERQAKVAASGGTASPPTTKPQVNTAVAGPLMTQKTETMENSGPSKTMSASGSVASTGTLLQPSNTQLATSGGTAGGGATGNRYSSIETLNRFTISDVAFLCAQDPTMRILAVSGSSAPATFTPTDQYNLYTILGCSFGNQAPTNTNELSFSNQAPTSANAPTDWVHIYGGTGSFYGKFSIRFWSDNEIEVSLDESLTGFPDLDNINLVVKRLDGQETQKGGFKFYAAREAVLLQTIPQSWVTLAAFPTPFQNPWTTAYSSPPASLGPNGSSPYPLPAIAPPGPSAGSAYISRSSNGTKYTWLSGVNDYYDFSHLAPGWTTDPSDQQHQPVLIPYDQHCPSGGGWTVTYKQSFGTWALEWDGNNLRAYLSDTSCSGFNGIVPFGLLNYQNWSGSYYALEVWVTGPRGIDPLSGNPVHP